LKVDGNSLSLNWHECETRAARELACASSVYCSRLGHHERRHCLYEVRAFTLFDLRRSVFFEQCTAPIWEKVMAHDLRSLVTTSYTTSTEDMDLSASPLIEVTISWGEQILEVQHLVAPYSFVLQSSQKRAHHRLGSFLFPEDVLGCGRVDLVADTPRGPVVILDGLPATAQLDLAHQGLLHASDLASHARTVGSMHAGVAVWPLGAEVTEVHFSGFRILLTVTAAAKSVPRVLFTSNDGHDLTYFGLSFLSAAGVLLSAAFFAPPLSLTAGEGLNRDDLILMQQYLDAAAEREEERKLELGQATEQPSGGEAGKRAEHNEGAMGDTQTTERNRRYQVKGPSDNPDPHLARAAALQDATTFGAIGMLHSFMAGSDAPTAPWGREEALGMDATSANGVMWADDIGTAAGSGGLGLAGLAEGGGGVREGVGVGEIGTLNQGMGGSGKYGFGSGHGHVQGTHRIKGPVFRTGAPAISGRLPPQVIQRIVRQNHGRFRLCYERGLGSNPSLEGRVNVRFVIGRQGAVTNATNGGSSLPAADVVNCVVKAFYGLSFPSPEGGLVTVSYPLSFSPD
jgi:hypothetical protein